VKGLYALGRMLWLEDKMIGGAKDVKADEEDRHALTIVRMTKLYEAPATRALLDLTVESWRVMLALL
jgi:hypothetical protein